MIGSDRSDEPYFFSALDQRCELRQLPLKLLEVLADVFDYIVTRLITGLEVQLELSIDRRVIPEILVRFKLCNSVLFQSRSQQKPALKLEAIFLNAELLGRSLEVF